MIRDRSVESSNIQQVTVCRYHFFFAQCSLVFAELNLLFLTLCQDARQKFRSVLVEATVKLDELVKKIGKAVEESKPYWEARRLARQVSQWCRDGGRWRHSELLLKVFWGARPSQVDSWVLGSALVLLSSNIKSQ